MNVELVLNSVRVSLLLNVILVPPKSAYISQANQWISMKFCDNVS